MAQHYICQNPTCNKPFTSAHAANHGGTRIPRFCSFTCYGDSRRWTPEERFWTYVDKSGGPDACWLWTGQTRKSGKLLYGYFRLSRKPSLKVSSHRYSYAIHKGAIPDDLYVLHNCPGGDNSLCCNPAHLWVGTQSQNLLDASSKGRLRNQWSTDA